MVILGKPPQPRETVNVHWVQSKRLIHGLGIASDDIQRRAVIKIASISFDHHRTDIHNEEIHAGAANLLYEYLYLAVLACSSLPLSTISSTNSTSLGGYKDIERICRIFNMIYRCSDYVAIHSFCEIGSKLLPLVLHVYQHIFPASNIDGTPEKSDTGRCQKFKTSVEHLLQRFCSLDVPLASMVDYQHLMAFLIRSISLHSASAFPEETHIIVTPHHNNNSTAERYQQCRHSINYWFLNQCLQVLVTLTNHPESKIVAMQQCPGLLQAIVLVAKPIADHHQLTIVQNKEILKYRTEAMRIFSNLAWESRNKTEMVRTKACINVLVDNLEILHESQEEADNPEANESAESALTSAINTLQYLSAAETSNKVRLVLHSKGKVLSVLMDILMRANHRITRYRSPPEDDTTTSYDDMLLVSCLETLLNLVCRETAKYIGRQQPHLFELLASYPSNTSERRNAKQQQVKNTNKSKSYQPSSSSTSPKVVNLAMQILLKFASYIQVNDSCHEQFMIAILATTKPTPTCAFSLSSSSSSLKNDNTEQEEEHQQLHPGQDDNDDHPYCLPPIAVAKILVYQSICGGSQTCFYMVRCNDIIQTLVRLCSMKKHFTNPSRHDDYDTVASVAMEALYNLTKQGGMMNAKKLVQHQNVMETLVNCISSSSSSSLSLFDYTNDLEKYSQKHHDSGIRIKCRRFAVKALLNLITTTSSCSSSHVKKKKKRRSPKQKSTSSWKDNHHDTTNTMIQVRCAKQMGLIASLAEYGISKDKDVRLKQKAIQGVLILTPLV